MKISIAQNCFALDHRLDIRLQYPRRSLKSLDYPDHGKFYRHWPVWPSSPLPHMKSFHVNATTAGFAYLLLVLVVASIWGFVEAVHSFHSGNSGFQLLLLSAGRHIQHCRRSQLGGFVQFPRHLADCQPTFDQGEKESFGCNRAAAGYRTVVYIQPRHSSDRQLRAVRDTAYPKAGGYFPAERSIPL